MAFGKALYQLLIGPLELLFETVFSLAYRATGNEGLSILLLSLAVNLLVLPLYRRADALQAEQRDTEARLRPWVSHIKKTFRGDERFMMLRTYYRQNGYKPTDSLKGALPLLLEVPFFIAAYRFLSELPLLSGAAFGPLRDLGAPDALLPLSRGSVNLLPVLMTVINLLSAALYLKGFSLKSKLQTVGMALVFLVLLYSSPSGLVFYWTLNNVFSLFKNIVARIPFPARRRRSGTETEAAPDGKLFFCSALVLALLAGVMVPASVLRSSPAEFVDILEYRSPLRFLVSSALLSLGFFVVWLGVFYRLSSARSKRAAEWAVTAAAVAGTVNCLFFSGGYGNLSPALVFDEYPSVPWDRILLNAVIVLLVGALVWLLREWRRALLRPLALTLALAVGGMSAFYVVGTERRLSPLRAGIASAGRETPRIELSADGKNVVVLMLDRAVGAFVPFLFEEKPELKEKFAGFTFYPNTASFAPYTLTASPAFFGGYDYTPEELNRRDDLLMVEKHNEALKVMPVLFRDNGWSVTVSDPTYAGYGWIPDLSVFDDYPDMRVFLTLGRFRARELGVSAGASEALLRRNLFCYGLFRTAPLFLRSLLYDRGAYNGIRLPAPRGTEATVTVDAASPSQERTGFSTAHGVNETFLKPYAVLQSLSSITRVTREGKNTFLLMTNDTTHEPMLLREPDYVPAMSVDNTEYDAEHAERRSFDGRTARLDRETDMIHYHANMASLLQIAAWLDTLREEGVYDNTRIIIASDHGRGLPRFESTAFGRRDRGVTFFNPLLLVKDFGAREFTVDGTFMTNADTPALAADGLIPEAKNPFTGRPLARPEAKAGELHILDSDVWETEKNNGCRLLPGTWYALRGGDLFDPANWKKIGDDLVLPRS